MKKLFALIMVVIISLGFIEIGLRAIQPAPLTYEQVLANNIKNHVRLFPANVEQTYNILGLYAGANKVILRTGPKRFIEPEPKDHERGTRILFLGGSTTESFYVPQSMRWVAQLHKPGEILAYNAGQSGANTLDEYFTFRHLTQERKMKFDVVVLMTAMNDAGWLKKFQKYNLEYSVETYKKNLRDWYSHKKRPQENFLDTFARISRLGLNLKVIWDKYRPSSRLSADARDSSRVVKMYRDWRRAPHEIHKNRIIEYEDCRECEDFLRDYSIAAKSNLLKMKKVVDAHGALLIVLSEAVSYLAPSGSFTEDFRIPLDFDSGVLSLVASDRLFKLFNKAFLQAANEAGAKTFDLAGALYDTVNGPEGGRYMYDTVHYTPQGCALVAKILRPLLAEEIKRLSLQGLAKTHSAEVH